MSGPSAATLDDFTGGTSGRNVLPEPFVATGILEVGSPLSPKSELFHDEAARQRLDIVGVVYHAMELALKAYLIQQGVSEEDLKNRFGHDIKKLVDKAVNLGLPLPHGSQEMIADLGGAPRTRSQATIAPHLRIRYPLGASVYSLGQFEPCMDHLFTAVASALGMSP
jgi:hypothetical protein